MDVNANIIKRFVIYMAILTFVMFTVWGFVKSFMNRPPGDYETEVCDIRLKDKKYDEAEKYFLTCLFEYSLKSPLTIVAVPSGEPSSTIRMWNDFSKENTLRIIFSIFSFSL